MAGIALTIRDLQNEDDLLAPVAALANAAVIAAGPWIYTALAIAAINEAAGNTGSEDRHATFAITLSWIFSLSLVSCTPVMLIGMRVLADELYLNRLQEVRTLFALTTVAGGVVSLTAASTVFLIFVDVSLKVGLIVIAGAQLAGMLWIALAFCGAAREYLWVSMAFAIGLVTGVVLAVVAVRLELGGDYMIIGFLVGLLIVFLILSVRLIVLFPTAPNGMGASLAMLLMRVRREPILAFGAFASGVGVWVDKWILWNSTYGSLDPNRLPHAPLYDTPMFVASLTVVPALALFVTALQTTFISSYRTYTSAIDSHGTLRSIEYHAEQFSRTTLKTLVTIIVTQAAVCVVVVLAAPAIIESTGLLFVQMGILRQGTIGALFQYMFISSSAILVFLNATRLYAVLQFVFATAIAATAFVSLNLSVEYLAVGYMLTCMLAGIASFALLVWVLRNVSYRTFIGSATAQ
jgi:polysaccharide biosynthesis protein PelG